MFKHDSGEKEKNAATVSFNTGDNLVENIDIKTDKAVKIVTQQGSRTIIKGGNIEGNSISFGA